MDSNSENCFIKNSPLSTVTTNEMVFVIVVIDYLIAFHPDMETINGTAYRTVNCEMNIFTSFIS